MSGSPIAPVLSAPASGIGGSLTMMARLSPRAAVEHVGIVADGERHLVGGGLRVFVGDLGAGGLAAVAEVPLIVDDLAVGVGAGAGIEGDFLVDRDALVRARLGDRLRVDADRELLRSRCCRDGRNRRPPYGSPRRRRAWRRRDRLSLPISWCRRRSPSSFPRSSTCWRSTGCRRRPRSRPGPPARACRRARPAAS